MRSYLDSRLMTQTGRAWDAMKNPAPTEMLVDCAAIDSIDALKCAMMGLVKHKCVIFNGSETTEEVFNILKEVLGTTPFDNELTCMIPIIRVCEANWKAQQPLGVDRSFVYELYNLAHIIRDQWDYSTYYS